MQQLESRKQGTPTFVQEEVSPIPRGGFSPALLFRPYQSFKVTAHSNQQRGRPWAKPSLPVLAGMEQSGSHLPEQELLYRRSLCSLAGTSSPGQQNSGVVYQRTGSIRTTSWLRRAELICICWLGS